MAQTTSEGTMAKRVTKRLTINLTAAQYEAFKTTMQAIRETNESEVLRGILAEFVNVFGPGWPDEEFPDEGKNWRRGKGGKFVKKP